MDSQDAPLLTWANERRYGVEMELNAFDGKNRPDKKDDLPKGIQEIGQLVQETVNGNVSVMHWHHTHNNEGWVLKPDSSCGLEVCTPVLKGAVGVENLCRVSQAFRDHPKIKSDGRCSLHVHVNVQDCTHTEIASIVAHWIKVEPVFLDAVPPNRKRSRYCQVVGMCDLFDTREALVPKHIIDRMGKSKYYTLNNHHLSKEARSTIEFRIAENDACLDPYYIKNWVRLVVHFVNRAKARPLPGKYSPGDPWTSFCWLDPKDVFRLLGFYPGQYRLSPGLAQVRNWFLARMQKYMMNSGLTGVWSDMARMHAWNEVQELCAMIQEAEGVTINAEHLYPSDLDDALYNKESRV